MRKLYRDQYGATFFASTLSSFKVQIPGKVSIMYVDTKEGKTLRVGYVIGQHWLTEYVPNRREA